MQEEWRPVPSFPDYEVSSLGRVRRIGRNEALKPFCGGRYPQLTLYCGSMRATVPIHQIVCAAFHGAKPTPEHEVAHGDGDRLNLRRDNLRWATHAENEADKLIHGTSGKGLPTRTAPERLARGATHGRATRPERTARGERNGLSRLTAEKVSQIRIDRRSRLEIAADYGISRTMVGYIVRGIAWAHVPMPQNQEKSCE